MIQTELLIKISSLAFIIMFWKWARLNFITKLDNMFILTSFILFIKLKLVHTSFDKIISFLYKVMVNCLYILKYMLTYT